MNYFHVIISYYYVFYLASFGLDATLEHYQMELIQSQSKLYTCGFLTYFPKSNDREDPNHYIFLETLPVEVKSMEQGIQLMNDWVEHYTLGSMRDIMTEITPNENTNMNMNRGMYKIMQSDIEHYIFDEDDDDDVFIVHKGKWVKLKFANGQDGRDFIKTLPSSITQLTDKASYESMMSQIENFNSPTTS